MLIGGEKDIEKGLMTTEPSPSPSPSSTATAPALVLSNSGKRMDQAGKKKYVKQVTGRHNDTELHLAAQKGDLAAVKQILQDIDSQIVGTVSGAEFDTEVAEVRAAVVNEVNELGETALFTAADRGHLDVVKELLKYSNKESVVKKNRSGFSPLHIAATQGHHGNDAQLFVVLCEFLGVFTTLIVVKVAISMIKVASKSRGGVGDLAYVISLVIF